MLQFDKLQNNSFWLSLAGKGMGGSLCMIAKSIGASTACGAGMAVERTVNPTQQPLNCRA